MITRAMFFSFTLAAGAGGVAHADEFVDASMQLCEKVKTCTLESMNVEEVTPEIRDMVMPMVENMCASMRRNYQEVPTGHALYKPALACMRSLSALSCEEIGRNRTQTDECKKYEAQAKQHAPS